jgi:hypothetical protein
MRIGDVIEDMLNGMLQVIKTNDRNLAAQLRKKDDVVDDLYTAVKLYLTQISREALDEKEGRRWADIVSFTINLEQVGDIIERVLSDIVDKKISKHRSFSTPAWAEICDLHARLVANLRLGMSVFLHGDLKSAQELLAQKVLFRDLERAYADSHLGRLAGNTLESIETSSLHLDLISDFKRINSHICSIAYPILEEAGVLARTRLMEPVAPPLQLDDDADVVSGRDAGRRGVAQAQAQDSMSLSISDICILFARKGGRAVRRRAGDPARARASKRHARGGLGSVPRHHHGGTAARPWPSPERPGRYPHLARHRRRSPVRRAAVPSRAIRRRRALADQAARRRQALPVRDTQRLYDALSVDSKRSLVLQGGVFSKDEAEAFIAQPHARHAVDVRLWDDLAKIAGAPTPPLAHS